MTSEESDQHLLVALWTGLTASPAKSKHWADCSDLSHLGANTHIYPKYSDVPTTYHILVSSLFLPVNLCRTAGWVVNSVDSETVVLIKQQRIRCTFHIYSFFNYGSPFLQSVFFFFFFFFLCVFFFLIQKIFTYSFRKLCKKRQRS